MLESFVLTPPRVVKQPQAAPVEPIELAPQTGPIGQQIRNVLRRNIDWPAWVAVAGILVIFVFLRKWFELSFSRGFEAEFPLLKGLLGEFGVSGCIPLHSWRAHVAALRDPSYQASWAPFNDWSYCLSALGHPFYLLSVLMTVVVPVVYRRELTWEQLNARGTLRPLLTLFALVLVWQGVASDYNCFLDNSFALDRVILLLSALLVWRHPAFSAWVLVLGFTNLGLLRYGVGWLSVGDRQTLYGALMLFLACLMFAVIQNRSWYPAHYRQNLSALYVFLLLCMIGSSYVWPALKKIAISPNGYEWAIYNELSNHTAYVLNRGWLSFLPAASREELVQWVRFFAVPLQLGTLAVELAAILLVLNRRISIAILLAASGLHVGIFAVSGVCFWKWVIVNLAAAGLLYGMCALDVEAIFKRRRALSFALMLTAPLYSSPVMLGWFDTPLSTRIDLEIEGVSGKVYAFNKSMADPYDMYFQFQRWPFLVDRPIICIGHGVESHRIYQELKANGADGAREYVARNGINHFDASKSARFDRFIETFFGTLNRHGRKPIQFGILSAPHHIYSGTYGEVYQFQEPISHVRVRFIEQYWTGQEMVTLDNQTIREIAISTSCDPWLQRPTAAAYRRKTEYTNQAGSVPVAIEVRDRPDLNLK